MINSTTYKQITSCGNLYITITDENNIFTNLGKAGGCAFAQSQALSNIINYSLENNLDPYEISKRIGGIKCNAGEDSCVNALAITLKTHFKKGD